MQKMLFSDMDGTIIDFNEMRHPQDKIMLEKLKEEGFLIAFNTGRNYQEAHFCVDKHNFPFDYLILNNGAHIVDKDGKEIFKKVIPQDVGRKIIEYCIQIPNQLTFFFNGKKTIGYGNGQTYEHASVGNVKTNEYDFLKEYPLVEEFDIIATFQMDEGVDTTIEIQKYIAENFKDYAHGCLNTHYLDITAQGCSKGSGVVALKDLINKEMETYCIGDSFNDISMFEVADNAYTFHHVNQEIMKHTDKQVDYVYEVIDDMLKEE